MLIIREHILQILKRAREPIIFQAQGPSQTGQAAERIIHPHLAGQHVLLVQIIIAVLPARSTIAATVAEAEPVVEAATVAEAAVVEEVAVAEAPR